MLALHGELKTHLMNRAKLSYQETKTYISHLSEHGLLEEKITSGGSTLYLTTNRGEKFLELYASLEEILDSHSSSSSETSQVVLTA